MKTTYLTLVYILLLSGAHFQLRGQVRNVPLSTLQNHSAIIAEGIVRASETFQNAQGNRIYTSYQLEVTDYLQGRGGAFLEVVQLGGCLNGHCQTLYPELALGLGQKGVFFLRAFEKEDLNRPGLVEVVSGPLGFVQFHELDGLIVGANATRIFSDIDSEIYVPIAGRKRNHKPSIINSRGEGAAPTISSIFPDTLAAGVHDTLSILGTEFGFTKGKVWFQNADLPSGFFMHGENPDLVFWSDTLIRVLVPTEGSLDSMNRGSAGTGPIRVESNDGMISQSSDSIFVSYGLKKSPGFL